MKKPASRQLEQLANKMFVNSAFDKLSKLEFMQYKWIAIEVIAELLIEYNKENPIVSNLTIKSIKRHLLGSNRFTADVNTINNNGYHYRTRRNKKRKKTASGCNTQSSYQFIMITGRGELPPTTNTDWYSSVITALHPSWLPISSATLALANELDSQATAPGTTPVDSVDDKKNDYETAAKRGPGMSLSLIERVVKRYKKQQKCHRNIFDSESKFLNDVVDRMWNQSSACHEP